MHRLDDELAKSFASALRRTDDKTSLLEGQRWWIREVRDPSSWSLAGLRSVYADRIMELDITATSPIAGKRGLVIGIWGAGAHTFENDVLLVGEKTLTYRSAPTHENCVGVPYSVVVEREGHGPGGGAPPEAKGRWTEVAIELHPTNDDQTSECKARVFDFSVPSDVLRHADLCIASSVEELRSGGCSLWGVYVKN